MSSAALCAIMLTVAVDYGYEPIEGSDGIRYVILIEPQMLDALRDGQPVESTILPQARGRVHSLQIVTRHNNLSKEIPPSTFQPTLPDASPPLPHMEAPADTPTQTAISWPPDSPTDSLPSGQPQLLPDPTSEIEPSMSMDGPSGAVDTTDPDEPETPKSDPWFLLLIASVVAVGSSGGMLFFGWLTFDYRSRYLGLLRESMDADNSWLEQVRDGMDRNHNASETLEATATAEKPREETSDTITIEDSSWQDLGTEPEDSLDDWLNEEKDRGRQSRRRRKRSR